MHISAQRRSRRIDTYRLLIGGFIIALLIGVQLLAALHRHHDGITDETCSVCQVVVHQLGDTPTPAAATPLPAWFVLYFTPASAQVNDVAEAPLALGYHSRAPPLY